LASQYGLFDSESGELAEIPTWDVFGMEIQQLNYQGQVLPVLVATWVLAKVEQFLNKRVPDMFKLLVVAPVALVVVGILTYTIIGDRKSTRLNSSHVSISYAVFCLKKKRKSS